MLQSTTLRTFDGGLNVIDDDMNLSYKYATVLDNLFVDSNGIVRVRYGTKLFARCAAYFTTPARIINMEYFNNTVVVVGSNGEVLKVLGDGSVQRIFDSTIAAALPDAPSGWSATEFVSFAQFNGHLILCNGIDKPLDIDNQFVVEYLQDAATNTNINVPICRYVATVGRYLVMAGDPLFPDRVHISARDAAGTWFGDPPPNDATHVDVGSIISDSSAIRGLLAFRGKLLVLYIEGTIVGTLGVYNDAGDHEPDFDDAIESYGAVSHRSAVASGDDGMLCDLFGVPSIRRTVLSTAFKPERISDLVDPLITEALNALSITALEDRVFRVYDAREGQYMLFVPNAETVEDTTETTVFVHNYRPSLKQNSWSVWHGWNFTCGCRSLQGNIFFGDADGNIWLFGNKFNPIYADYVDMLSTPVYGGTPITFDWTMPWLDFGKRDTAKESKYLSFDTRGQGEFTAEMYVDNFNTVSLSTEFSGGEQGLFGTGDQPYGGGRNTSYKKLYSWPARFQIARLRLSGSTTEELAFVSMTMKYRLGSIRP